MNRSLLIIIGLLCAVIGILVIIGIFIYTSIPIKSSLPKSPPIKETNTQLPQNTQIANPALVSSGHIFMPNNNVVNPIPPTDPTANPKNSTGNDLEIPIVPDEKTDNTKEETIPENKIMTFPELPKITLKEWLTKIEHVGQYRDLAILKNIPKEKIIVVRNDLCDGNIKKAGKGFDGNYDHIQDVLTKLEIPHTLIGKSELDKDDYSVDDKWAIIFNCNFFKEHCCNPEHLKLLTHNSPSMFAECPGDSNHITHSTKLSDKTIQKIKRFVEVGGYLFTEDLNIEETIERAFKGTITHTKFLPEKDVTVSPAPDVKKHPYLKNVFEFPVQPQESGIVIKWRIDNESPDIKLLNKEVVVLILSPQFINRSNPKGPVAVTFSVVDNNKDTPAGQVLHVMTHFDRQSSKTGEFALQNLLVNFLMEMAEKRK